MSIEALKDALPEYAKDLKLNLSALASDETLNDQQRWGTFLATALACGNPVVIRSVYAEVRDKLTEDALTAAKAASAIMGMNNIYYRFVHLVGGEYATMPAKLRMNVIGKPGVDKVDFELWSMAVSAINGCGMCMESHNHQLREHVGGEVVQAAVKIAAVVHAVSATLTAEANAV